MKVDFLAFLPASATNYYATVYAAIKSSLNNIKAFHIVTRWNTEKKLFIYISTEDLSSNYQQ